MRAIRAFLTLLACALTRPALAESMGSLEVERSPGAESCPDASALAARVAELEPGAELSVGSEPASKLHFRVTLERRAEHWSARIQMSGERHGDRTLTDSGEQCSGLGEAVALTLAMLIEPEDPASPAVAPAAPTVTPAPSPLPPPPADPAPRSRTEPAFFELDIGAGAAATVGLLERAGVALTGDLEVGVTPAFRAGLGVIWAPAQEIEHGPGHVDVSLLALTLSLCFDVFGERERLEVALCATQAGGEVRGSGHGYDGYTDSAGRPWLAFGGGARARGNIFGPLGYSAGILLLTPLTQERFAVAGVAGEAFEPSAVALVAGAGLRLSIW